VVSAYVTEAPRQGRIVFEFPIEVDSVTEPHDGSREAYQRGCGGRYVPAGQKTQERIANDEARQGHKEFTMRAVQIEVQKASHKGLRAKTNCSERE
jgi:hypothetical protein